MKLIRPRFWLKKSVLSILLLPLTIFTYIINLMKKIYPKKKNLTLKQFVLAIYLLGTRAKHL